MEHTNTKREYPFKKGQYYINGETPIEPSHLRQDDGRVCRWCEEEMPLGGVKVHKAQSLPCLDKELADLEDSDDVPPMEHDGRTWKELIDAYDEQVDAIGGLSKFM